MGVYGASGCGRGILPLLRDQDPVADIVFIDDGKAPGCENGHDILNWHSFLETEASSKAVSIAIAASKVREKLADQCDIAGIPLTEVRATSVVEMDGVEIGEGACLSPFVTLTSNIKIGRCFHANLYSYVEHDCVLGDYVTFAPGVKCNGNVTLGDHVYVGSGAVIKQGVTIGKGAIIGMGAVVTKDVPAGITVVGNPARPLIKD